jgi:hypothetical protein
VCRRVIRQLLLFAFSHRKVDHPLTPFQQGLLESMRLEVATVLALPQPKPDRLRAAHDGADTDAITHPLLKKEQERASAAAQAKRPTGSGSAAADRLPVVDNPNAVLVDETATLATVAAFQRQDDDTLTTLPTTTLALSLAEVGVGGSFGAERAAQVTAMMPESVAAGGMLDLRLTWQLGDPGLLERYVPFVHLRQDGQTIAQRDGRPRYFVTLPLGQSIPDWRQIPVPVGATGEAEVVIGLFDPSTGERIDVFDAGGRPVGNELSLGRVAILPPLVPDQACALIPAACASQSR